MQPHQINLSPISAKLGRLWPLVRLAVLVGVVGLCGEVRGAGVVRVGDIARAQVGDEACVGFNRRHDTVGASMFRPPSKTPPAKPRDLRHSVKRGDIFQITLSQALVADLTDLNLFGRDRGDIAIVVNVRERGSGDDFDFRPGSENSGRVVFFQRNVKSGAPLNLASLPIYGPARYDGKPLMVTVHIVEIDEHQNTLASGLVDTLANLSKTVAPVNAAAISILNSLGGALLRSNKNDIIAEYRAEFLPAEIERPEVRTMALEYGNYAFIVTRPKFETNWHPWDTYRFDQRNARLYESPKDQDVCLTPLKSSTWLTFQVNGGFEPSTLPSSNTLGSLVQSLSKDSENQVSLLKSATDELINAGIQRKRFRHYLALLESTKAETTRNAQPSTEVRGQIDQLVNDIDESLKTQDKSKAKLDQIQCERLVSDLQALLESESDRRLFSVNVFDTALVKRLLETRFIGIGGQGKK